MGQHLLSFTSWPMSLILTTFFHAQLKASFLQWVEINSLTSWWPITAIQSFSHIQFQLPILWNGSTLMLFGLNSLPVVHVQLKPHNPFQWVTHWPPTTFFFSCSIQTFSSIDQWGSKSFILLISHWPMTSLCPTFSSCLTPAQVSWNLVWWVEICCAPWPCNDLWS